MKYCVVHLNYYTLLLFNRISISIDHFPLYEFLLLHFQSFENIPLENFFMLDNKMQTDILFLIIIKTHFQQMIFSLSLLFLFFRFPRTCVIKQHALPTSLISYYFRIEYDNTLAENASNTFTFTILILLTLCRFLSQNQNQITELNKNSISGSSHSHHLAAINEQSTIQKSNGKLERQVHHR